MFAVVNASVLVLHWRERGRDRSVRGDHFRTWWPLPVLAIVTCGWLSVQQPAEVYLRAAVLLAAGGVLWGATRLAHRRASAG